MLDFGQPMFNSILPAAHTKHMRHVSCCRTVRVARRESELDPVVGENRVDLVGDSRDRASRKAEAEVFPVFLTSCTKANLLVRSMAT